DEPDAPADAAPAAGGAAGAAGTPGAAADKIELFDLKADPGEKANVAAKEPDVVKRLRARYDGLAKEAVPPKNRPKAKDFKVPAVWGEAGAVAAPLTYGK
ncbi:MAG: atsA 16, partial [Phycisphaerales bacterium]|nr:atsA 16 [Phycisphaerales bacterium]